MYGAGNGGRVCAAVLLALAAAGCTGELTGGEPRPDLPSADAGSDPGGGGGGSGAGADAAPDFLGLSPEEQALFAEINAQREARDLVAVALSAELSCAAARHSMDIGTTRACTHTGADGSSPGDRVDDCGGGGWSGEIVACGQGTAVSAVQAWVDSPGHNAILFDPGQRYVGVAMHQNFWTAIFYR